PCFQKTLHIQQGKALLSDTLLVTLFEHGLKHLLLGNLIPIVIGEQGGQRRGATTEIVLLSQHGLKTAFFVTGDGNGKISANAGDGNKAGMGGKTRYANE